MAGTNKDGYTYFQLRAFMEAGTMVSLFIDPTNPDDFVAGYICALNSRCVAIQSVSPFGRYDGYLVAQLSDITMIMGEDDYTTRLRRAIMLRGEEPLEFPAEEGEDPMHMICRWAQERDQVLSIWTHDSECCGPVLQLDDIRVTLATLDYFGGDPRPLSLPIREIEIASSGSEDDLLMDLLFKGGSITDL